MKTIKLFIICLLVSIGWSTVKAQDKIIRRDGKVILSKIIEIGTEEIKYSTPEYDYNVQFSIEKIKVEKIVFESGKEFVIDHAEAARESTESNSADLFLVQNKNAIKINFLSPMLSKTFAVAYERALKPGQSLEFELGIVGLGFDDPGEQDPLGVGIRWGYKFIRSPDFYVEKMRYAHILKGAYVKPELAFSSYNLRKEDRIITKGALLLTFGKQHVFNDIFLTDLFVSFGYGFTTADEFTDYPYYFAVIGGDTPPIAFAWGLRIGFLL